MSASLRTKDGSISTAALVAKHEVADAILTRIDLDSALAWARDNCVKIGRSDQAIGRINKARVGLGLPPFKIIQRRAGGAGVPSTRANNAPPQLAVAASATPELATSQEDLLALVTKHEGTLTRLVTPRVAEWLLAINTANRPIQGDNTARFRLILRDGRWVNTGEPIIVSREGVLNDGQHRLSAIKDTGIGAEVDVRFGIAREAFQATGTGKRRTVANILSIEGYPNASSQAAIARLLRHYDKGAMGQHRGQVEPSEILKIVDAEDRIGQVAARIAKFRFGSLKSGAFGFVLVVAARGTPIEKVFAFADLVASGATENEADPARRLHVQLRNAALRREYVSQLDLSIMAVRSWNSWISGRLLQSFRPSEKDRTSAGFPKILCGVSIEPLAT